MEIRKTNVLGYSNLRRKEDYKSQIFFDTPNLVQDKKKPTYERPSSSHSRYIEPAENKVIASSTESKMGSTSYINEHFEDESMVRVTLQLKASHTDKKQLKKFEDKLTIVNLGNGKLEVSGNVPLRIAKLFKIIFQDSEFKLEKARY